MSLKDSPIRFLRYSSSLQVDFGLPINIDDMIDELDEDGSGEIEWPEFKKLFTRPTETPDFNPKDLSDVTSGAHGITNA